MVLHGVQLISESCRENIKQVKKQYIAIYNDPSSNNNYTDDQLWLLSCSELWTKPATNVKTGVYAFAIAQEGEQYKWYEEHEGSDPETSNSAYEKYMSNGVSNSYWLRSPGYENSRYQCGVACDGQAGMGQGAGLGGEARIAPGFCL